MVNDGRYSWNYPKVRSHHGKQYKRISAALDGDGPNMVAERAIELAADIMPH
ncbi:MAG: hypothetical protein ACLTQI_02225 [Slackia sp.]